MQKNAAKVTAEPTAGRGLGTGAAIFAVMPQKEWFQTWFGSPYYRKLYGNRDSSEAEAFTEALFQKFPFREGASVLDIACGEGRLSRAVAAYGHDVTGIDLSATSIAIAKEKAADAQNLTFYVHDMRLPFRINYFDLALNFFTSFGYFGSRRDNQTAARTFAGALKPGGMFVIDYLNSAKVLREMIPEQKLQREGTDFLIRKRLEDGIIVKTISFEDADGKPRQFEERVAAFGQDDLETLFKNAGLTPVAYFGDYNLCPFDESESPRLIIAFKK